MGKPTPKQPMKPPDEAPPVPREPCPTSGGEYTRVDRDTVRDAEGNIVRRKDTGHWEPDQPVAPMAPDTQPSE